MHSPIREENSFKNSSWENEIIFIELAKFKKNSEKRSNISLVCLSQLQLIHTLFLVTHKIVTVFFIVVADFIIYRKIFSYIT